MPNQINVAGVTLVKVDYGSGLVDLGYALDMPEIRDQSFHHDVPGDQHGGPQGPPIDRQFLGRLMHVRVELSKYDRAHVLALRARLRGNTAALAGTVRAQDVGALMQQDSKSMRCLLSNANDPMNFPICLISEPIEVAVGTKFSALVLEFEAHRNMSTGVIYNDAIS